MFAYVTVKKNTHSTGNDTQCSKNGENNSIFKINIFYKRSYFNDIIYIYYVSPLWSDFIQIVFWKNINFSTCLKQSARLSQIALFVNFIEQCGISSVVCIHIFEPYLILRWKRISCKKKFQNRFCPSKDLPQSQMKRVQKSETKKS